MPTIGVKRDLLFQTLGKTYSDDEFQQLCFAFGLELDEVTTEKQMLLKEQGDEAAAAANASEEIIYRIDIPANRHDLLCLEGLTTSLLIFQNKINPPQYRMIEPKNGQHQMLRIRPETAQIRPYAVAAILRNIHFTPESYASFIDLQDKLHQNIGRKRSLVAIGTHDLDTIQGPFSYEARSPDLIKFIPLNQSKSMNGNELMSFYSVHPQLKQYLPIIRDSPVYPVIYDSNGVVLSLPPIINGDHSKISLNTRNVFIECTATDLTKAQIVLDTIVCMFSVYCQDKFTVEPCDVIRESNQGGISTSNQDNVLTCPKLKVRQETIFAHKVNSYIGIEESPLSIVNMLNRMSLQSEWIKDAKLEKDLIRVSIPPTRQDVIHACDIYEDVAIAYGYNRIRKSLPRFMHIAKQYPLNKLTEQLREQVAQSGFTEALTFTLCSRDDLGRKMNRDNVDTLPVVHISNPKTLEFQVVRTTLLPGLLKTLVANRNRPLPLKLFEISDVVLTDETAEVGARNERHLCAVNSNKNAGFEVVHGLLDRVMQLLEVPWQNVQSKEATMVKTSTSLSKHYWLESTEDASYFPGRCAHIMYNGVPIGRIGVLHPTVLEAFELTTPCSVLELNIEPFV